MIKLQDYLSCFTIVENYPDAKRVVDRFEEEHERIKKELKDVDFRLGSVMSEKALQALRNVGIDRFGIGIRSVNPYSQGFFRDLMLSEVIDFLKRVGIETEEEAIELFESTKGIMKGGKIIAECKEYIFPHLIKKADARKNW